MTTPQETQQTTPPPPTTPHTPTTPAQPLVAPLEPVVQKKSPLVAILLTLLILATSAAAYFYSQSRLTSPAPIASTSPIPTATTDPTADWETYINSISSYSLKYPPQWTIVDLTDGQQIEIYYQPDKTKSVGSLLIENITLPESALSAYTKPRVIGTKPAICSDNPIKTRCYLVNQKISILIVADQDSTYNETLNQILQTFQLTNQSTSTLPNGWTYQHIQDCNVLIPTPPIIANQDNRQWTMMEERVAQPFGLWKGRSDTLMHRNPEEASGYISGMVTVSCGSHSPNTTNNTLLSELQQHLEAEKAANNDSDFIIQIASSTNIQKWGLPVIELMFSGGMYNPTQKYYLFAKDNSWYLTTSKSDSASSIIQSQTSQILDLLTIN